MVPLNGITRPDNKLVRYAHPAIAGEYWNVEDPVFSGDGIMPITHGDQSNTSGPSMSYGHFFSFHNHRHFSHPTGVFQHLFKLSAFSLYVNILGFITKCRPGTCCEGSTALSKNNHFLCHEYTFLLFFVSTPILHTFQIHAKFFYSGHFKHIIYFHSISSISMDSQ